MGCCWEGPGHVAFIPWTSLWKESGGFGSFKLGKPLSAQSLMSRGGRLDDNAESGAGDRGLAVTFHRGVREFLRCSIVTFNITYLS